MSALCNFISYLYYSALISFSGLYLFSVSLFLPYSLSVYLYLLKQFYSGSYTVRIASLQGSHGYFYYKVKNKNKIRQSWKIYRVKYNHLLLYCSLPFIRLSFLHYTTLCKTVLTVVHNCYLFLYMKCLGGLYYNSLYPMSLHSTLAHLRVPFLCMVGGIREQVHVI